MATADTVPWPGLATIRAAKLAAAREPESLRLGASDFIQTRAA